MLIGKIKVAGVGLGAAAVLFLAIALSAWANSYGVDLQIKPEIGTLGLALFAFAIGITSGQGFFAGLKSALLPILTLLATLLTVGILSWAVGTKVLGMDMALVSGTFAGATTNTPALAAAGAASGSPQQATVGYSIAYIFGVIGMLICTQMALNYGKNDRDRPTALANRTIRVERVDQPTISDLFEKYGEKLQFSRLRRGESGPVARPKPDSVLREGDLVTVVGPVKLVHRIVKDLGHGSSHSLIEDRSYLDFRRITLSDPKLSGHTIASLELDKRFSATVSRVRRGDVDMAAEPDLVLLQGDRIRVVAPTAKMKEVSKFLGDSSHGLSDINPVALGIGMALGALIGELPIPLPGGGTFSIGIAAGTLIFGLVMGYFGRIGRFTTSLPFTAAQALSELGLLIFLAQAGTTAGGQIAEAFTGGSWWRILVLGIIITLSYGLILYAAMRWLWKMGGTQLSGLLAGAQTQPAVLAFANSRTGADPRVALGYAMVYPMAMIGKIMTAQILGGL